MSRSFLAGTLPALLCLFALAACTSSPLLAQEETKEAAPAAAAEAPAADEAAPPATDEAAKEEAPAIDEAAYSLDNMILFLAAVLVIFMQPGFALVESGLNASKNAVNIMFKNFMDLAIGVVLFFLIGYGLMFPVDSILVQIGEYKIFGFGQIGIGASPASNVNSQVFFLFQVAFAATAATIVSGAVAGRIKFHSYLVYSAIVTGLIYPISGMWQWGGGWLSQLGFVDFAGSVVVHAVGGFAGLAGAIALGPRLGRFINGKSMPMPGHNIPFAALGVFVLWVGWYGFNPGSQLAFMGQANTDAVVKIATNTTLAAATGAIGAMILSWLLFKKPDLTMALNGALGGLVGITANCHAVENWEALVIGLAAGGVVTAAILALDKLQIDDPVGAFPVHGACGIWGGLAMGIFGDGARILPQLIGTGAICAWALGTSLVLFFGLKAIGLLRVDAEEEIAGLDISEHGMYAYPPALVTETYGTSIPGAAVHAPAGAALVGKPGTEAV